MSDTQEKWLMYIQHAYKINNLKKYKIKIFIFLINRICAQF